MRDREIPIRVGMLASINPKATGTLDRIRPKDGSELQLTGFLIQSIQTNRTPPTATIVGGSYCLMNVPLPDLILSYS